MKKILITGGAGFIGFHLAKHLLTDHNVSLVLVDNLLRGKVDSELSELLKDKRVKFLEGDLTDLSFFNLLDKDFDQIYHLAAINGTKNFYKMPSEVLRINTLTTIYILEWARNLAKKPKICFTSSNEAYAGALAAFGKLPIPTPENVPLVIEDTYNPRWSYGATKALDELLMINYCLSYSLPGFIVRPHNFYGPRAGYDHVIPEMSARIIKKENPFTVYGADETRTFCYIIDAVSAMQQLMDSNETNSQPIETFHIGNTDEITMKDLALKFFNVSGFKPDKLEFQPGLAGSVKRRLADISKIKKLISWEPKISLSDGLKKTFEWYKSHPKNY